MVGLRSLRKNAFDPARIGRWSRQPCSWMLQKSSQWQQGSRWAPLLATYYTIVSRGKTIPTCGDHYNGYSNFEIAIVVPTLGGHHGYTMVMTIFLPPRVCTASKSGRLCLEKSQADREIVELAVKQHGSLLSYLDEPGYKSTPETTVVKSRLRHVGFLMFSPPLAISPSFLRSPGFASEEFAARQRSGVAGGSKRWLGGAVRGARAVQGPGGGDACRFFGEMKGFPGGKMGVKPCN